MDVATRMPLPIRPTHPAPSVTVDAAAARNSSRKLDNWARFFLAAILLSWGAGLVVGFQPALFALTALGFLAAIFGMRRPLVGLVGIGMLSTLDAVSRALLMTGGLLRWNSFNYWLICAMLLNVTFFIKLKDVHSRLVLLFILLLSFGLLFTAETDMESGYMSVLNVLAYFGMLVYFSRQTKDPRVWYLQGLVCGTLAAVGSLVYYLQKSGLPYVNPNAWSYFPLTAIFSLCLGYQFAPRGWKSQIPFWLLAVTNYAWIFLSGSRGSMLVGSACMLFLLFTTRSMSQRFIYAISAVLIGLVVIHNFTDLDAEAIHRVTKLLNPNEKLAARTSGRSDLALAAWIIFTEHPFGVGTGGFGNAWAKMGYREDLSGFKYGTEMQAHSGWTKTLAENGVLGITVLISLVASFAIVGWKKRRLGIFPIGFIVTTVFSLAFLATDFQGKGLWYFAAGATVLLSLKATSPLIQHGMPQKQARPAEPAMRRRS